MEAIQNKLVGPVSDEMALVRAAKGGDDSAFEELVRRYDRNVFRIAQHITQNREDAEDVVQEAFLKAYGNLAQFQEQSKFYTWLVRIAVNGHGDVAAVAERDLPREQFGGLHPPLALLGPVTIAPGSLLRLEAGQRDEPAVLGHPRSRSKPAWRTSRQLL